MAYFIIEAQLQDIATAESIISSGGMAVVCKNNSPDLETLYDPDNDFAALTQPVSLTRGKLRFAVADTVNKVDIFGIAPSGMGFHAHEVGVQAQAKEIFINKIGMGQIIMPFSHADSSANTEEDTGLEIPEGVCVLPQGIGIEVVDIDATETIDIGLLSTESGGDADGFMAAISVATQGFVLPTLASGGQTLGALLRADEGGTGELVPEAHVGDGTAKTLSYTTSAGSDTVSGYAFLPVFVPATVL